jgi:hypothetical protein
VAKNLPEAGLYQKIIHRTEKLLTGLNKSRPLLRKSNGAGLICGRKFAIIIGFPDQQGICQLDLP